MFVMTLRFSRKKAVFIVIMAALVLIGIILLVGAHSKRAELLARSEKVITSVKSEKDRVSYLAQYGWEVESPALTHDTVVIPRTFSDVFDEYNSLQLSQGFDLSQYCGLEAEMYTYRVTNSEEKGDVIAQLYIRNNEVIGGDVHSTALDGFMAGVKPSKEKKGLHRTMLHL